MIFENEILGFLQSGYWDAGGVNVAGETTEYSRNALRRWCCLRFCAVRLSIYIYFLTSLVGAKPGWTFFHNRFEVYGLPLKA